MLREILQLLGSGFAQGHAAANTHFRFLKISIVLLCCISSTLTMSAQSSEAIQGYRFEVSEVSNNSEAKVIITDLTDLPFITSVDFSSDCHCFKVVSDTELDYRVIARIISQSGHEMEGTVMTHRGVELEPMTAQTEDE